MRNRYFLIVDLLLLTCSALLAFALRFDWLFYRARTEVWPFVLAVLLVKPVVFLALGVYRRYWQYAGLDDVVVLLAANLAASLALVVLVPVGFAFGLLDEFPRSVILIDLLAAFVLTGGVRFAVRAITESSLRTRKIGAALPARRRRVLVAGAGGAGALVARESRRNPQIGYDIVGFLDDDPVKQGKRIADHAVLGTLADLPACVDRYRVDEVVIAMPTARGATLRGLVESCQVLGVRSRILPGVYELLGGRVNVRRLRDVDITDLLKRAPIEDSSTRLEYLTDRTVLVTGAGGSIGAELCRQVATVRPRLLVLLGHGENSIFDVDVSLRQEFPGLAVEPVIADIRDRSRVQQIFDRIRPDVVLHAAAHKHVPLMEANPEEAVTNNVIGTACLVTAAIRSGTERFVLVSSDKAVSPTSIMGASKRLAEHVVHAAARIHHRAFAVVRFGNVLGSRGSVVPMFKKQIERGGPITITHPEMRRYFMTIPEAVHLVLHAGGLERGGEVFVLNMGDMVPVVDIARDLVRLSGLSPDEIPVVFTGVRPGEKLTEELWEEEARVEHTAHRDIFRVVEPDGGDLDGAVASAFAAVASTDWPAESAIARLTEHCRALIARRAPDRAGL